MLTRARDTIQTCSLLNMALDPYCQRADTADACPHMEQPCTGHAILCYIHFHENDRAHGVEVFGHCSAVSAHGSAVEKHRVSGAWLLRARKHMSRVSPLTLRVQRHI